mmetsp:Transcript_13919/g.21033  ORF Transcript_13919/g.21033 Transcript_13919/m.21033 type:complete len:987 (-) Transcript_13919:160-3120(-)|eukprot:CAMPEP_0167757134 /NCGR_PEP_ID=MMETSP0110_2-20121227/9760_1 /TAXON_ID=629695 /ORGANISM="Gymnochlora sp., Strain CCMP2014" /LENGTH=986 /DNA_ID=CAMNT_0007643297 /DNA_START=50 /DNA_END=3010 /DNA_ORIENTATION=+
MGEALAEWEHKNFSDILGVTLVGEAQGSKGNGSGRVHLKDLESDLRESTEPLQITSDNLDSVFFERLNLPFKREESAFGYLVRCYRSVVRVASALARKPGPKDADKSLAELRKSLTRYSGIVLSSNDMLEEAEHRRSVSHACRLLSQGTNSAVGLPDNFLAEVVAEMDSESLAEAFNPIINSTIANPRTLSLMNCNPPLMCLQNLTSVSALAAVVVRHPQFNPKGATNGKQLQTAMLLGPYLALTTNGNDPRFVNAHQRSQAVTDTRVQIANLQSTVTNILFNMLKAGGNVQELVLEWMSKVMRMNLERRKMQFDHMKVSSQGFFVNMGAVMVTLSKPFINSKKDRVPSVVPRFLIGKFSNRISYDLCTRLSATKNDLELLSQEIKKEIKISASVDKKDSKRKETTVIATKTSNAKTIEGKETKSKISPEGKRTIRKKINMVTEMFFLTMEALHLGYVRTLQALSRIMREIVQCQETIEFVGGENSANPMAFGMKLQLNSLRSSMVAMKTHLLDPKLLRKIFSLYGWAARWMRHTYETNPNMFKAIPEYFAADICNLYVLMNRFEPIMLRSQPMEHVMRLVVTLMDSNLLKNAQLRGQLPDVLTLALPVGSIASPDHMLVTSPFFTKGLIPRLLGLYVQIEFGENQFYGKFHTRYTISQILKYLWQHPVYHESLKQYERTKMIRFINMLCNDAVWLLDEALKHLEDVKREQKEMAAPDFIRQPPFTRRRREAQFMQLQRTTRSQMNLAYSSIQMIGYMSQGYREPFLSGELVGRVAEMINYYINKLNGPRVSSLKVKEPKKFGFRPKVLLRELVRIFLIFAEDLTFLKAVASDARSYDATVFNKAAMNLKKRDIVSEGEQRRFRKVLDKLEALAAEMKMEEDAIGEVPDKYLDPLMATIMTDPVMLPKSRVVVDRSVILRHLLNSTTDPFNRSELHTSDLISMPKLKQEIDEFVKKKRSVAVNSAKTEEKKSSASDTKLSATDFKN